MGIQCHCSTYYTCMVLREVIVKEAAHSFSIVLMTVVELQAVFAVFDKDNDGFISVHEVTAVLASMGVRASSEYISDIFNQVDLDGSVSVYILTHHFTHYIILTVVFHTQLFLLCMSFVRY